MRVSPHPSPLRGRVAVSNSPVFTGGLLALAVFVTPPTSVGLWLARLPFFEAEAALAKTSLTPVAHAPKRVCDGRVLFCEKFWTCREAVNLLTIHFSCASVAPCSTGHRHYYHGLQK